MTNITKPDHLSDEQVELFGRLAEKVVKLGFALPAILFLETMRPMNFVGSQVMLFFQPMIRTWFTIREYDLFQKALENRETLGYLTDLIEDRDIAQKAIEKELKAKLKAEKRAKKEAKRKS
ncbi:MAG: hypothetical protein KDB65_09250 [Calditrichaeota bacterium]|nr:hypothetical protein [Calditrichota bacterium]MCB9369072.1 hypothetical protein [Calditrichota bacterium]